jgi:hypothetical protein
VIAFRKRYDKLIFIMFGISTWQRRAIGELAPSKQEGLQISPTQPPEMQGQQPQIVVSFDVRRLYFQVAKNHWSLTAFLLALVHSTKMDTGEINKLQKTVQCSMDAAEKSMQSARAPEKQPNVLDLFGRKTFLQLTRALLLRKNDIPQDVASLLEVDHSKTRIHLVTGFTTQIGSLKPAQTPEQEVPADQPETRPKGAEQPISAKTVPVPFVEGQEPGTPDAAKTDEIQLSLEDTRKLSAATRISEAKYVDGIFSVTVDGNVIKIPDKNGILDLSSCVNLTSLEVEDVPGLKGLELPVACPKLKIINLSKCTDLEAVDFSGFTNLTEIKLIGCKNLNELKLPLRCDSLKEFSVIWCCQLKEIDASRFPGLVCINLDSCSSLSELKFPAKGNSFKILSIMRCHKIGKVDISSCEYLEDVHISQCCSLTEVTIGHNLEITGFTVSSCRKLSCVDLRECDYIKYVAVEGSTTIIAPNHFHCVIDADGSSRAVMQALRNAGATLA